jgi:magnesium-transporting ATPase (P-type)
MQKLKQLIKESPGLRTGIFFFSVIISGVLCSAFVGEITQNGKLIWKDFYQTISFWGIMIYVIIIYTYNRFLYIYEKNILRFLDDDYCKAYIVQACLPEIIEKYKEDIRGGKDVNEIIDISKELKKLKK